MADKKKKPNIFTRIGQRIKEIRLELKRVVWPSKEKMKSTSVVVLVVIVFFAIFLSVISLGGHWALDKMGFYDQVETTPAPTTTTTVEATTTTTVEETSEAAE